MSPMQVPPLRVLTFTTVFPNPVRPEHGLFVLERIRHCAAMADIRVVAPRPFYPWPAMNAVPKREVRAGLAVEHPTFRYVPRVAKWLDGMALFLSASATVGRLAREAPFDVIDAHFGYPDGFAAVLLGWRLRLPVVVTLRGTEPLVAAADPGRRRAVRFALRHTSRIIAVSEPLARFARENLDGLPPASKPPVTVIANGVDLRRFAPAPRDAARRALGLPEAGRLLVSVGHLSPRKGFQRVLRVLPDLVRDTPDLTFAVIGGPGAEGNNEAELRRLAAEPALAGRVIFAGSQPPERVSTWLNAADLFVLASDYEGCPNVVWEALACGLPVVAAKVGEVERMVPAFTGHLIDDADDLPALRAALAAGLAGGHDRAAIRAWAGRHGWEGVAARVMDEWTAAAAAAPRTAPAVAQRGYAA
jgi:glycosyltransferase involved in cell wall biosynthesis